MSQCHSGSRVDDYDCVWAPAPDAQVEGINHVFPDVVCDGDTRGFRIRQMKELYTGKRE